MGILEFGNKEIPIIGCIDLGLTVDQIEKCLEAS